MIVESLKPTSLAIHLVRDDGKPGCGDPVRDWEGSPATFVTLKATTIKAALVECPDSLGPCARNGCFPS
jgi:hypothetical protein